MASWGRLEHHVWSQMAAHGLQQKDCFALCVSGGLDSMVLLQLFLQLKPMAQIKVLHFHHGPDNSPGVMAFREQSLNTVKKRVSDLNKKNVVFMSHTNSESLTSEEQFRDARWKFINQSTSSDDVVVTGHHLDDRFETIFLKMLRGTSIEGVSSFQMWNGRIFRPLLDISKAELLEYAQKSDLMWAEDPTNQESDYLRNWLRREWLQSLEDRVPGGKANLARSLFKIIEDHNDDRTFEESFLNNFDGQVLNRHWYSLLSQHNQLRALAMFLKRHSVYEFTTGQLEEMRKRLDKNQKELTFELLGRKWVINATQIVIE